MEGWVDSSMPRLRAAASPLLCWQISRTSGQFEQSALPPSVEPSSTTIISRGLQILSEDRLDRLANKLPPLNKGMMAETGAVLVILLLVH